MVVTLFKKKKKIEELAKAWQIKINVEKSINFKFSFNKASWLKTYLNGPHMQINEKVIYLRVHL